MGVTKVVVGLSGGVDSAVAALLLKEAGFDVSAVYLKCYWTGTGCQSDQDRVSAARVAAFLSLPFEVWDFEKEYRARVVDYFYSEYKKGLTPNPDVACNREIKFGLFLKEARKRGYDFVATGHYAGTSLGPATPFFYERSESDGVRLRVNRSYFSLIAKMKEEGRVSKEFYPTILAGTDQKKDQSYFLYDISAESIEYILYPLYELNKGDVREIARLNGLPNAERKDSSGICFIGEVKIEALLKERIAPREGKVVDREGRLVGRHKGVEFYTIGQRHGFVIIPVRVASRSLKESSPTPSGRGTPSTFALPPTLTFSNPLYVIAKNIEKNELVVGRREECKRDGFEVEIGDGERERNSFLDYTDHDLGSQAFVRIRNLGEMIPCQVELSDHSDTAFSQEPAVSSLLYKSELVSSRRLLAHQASQIDSALLVDRGLTARAFSKSGIQRDFSAVVKLSDPVFGVAPGQSAVFYRKLDGGSWQVVGGGVIAEL